MLSERSKAEIRRIQNEFPDSQSALVPALTLAQADCGGWLPERALEEVAAVMSLAPSLVAAAASFYTMLNQKPVGQHLVQVCTNIACSLLGANHLVEHIGRKLGIQPGETTADGKFTLLKVECLGSCGTAPVMQIDDRYFEDLTADQIDEILAAMA